MLCKNVIGCDERCWIICMSQAFPKQLFIAAKRTNVNSKKNFAQKNSGAPSQVIEDLTRSPAIQCWMSFDKTKLRQANYISTIGQPHQIIHLNSPPHRYWTFSCSYRTLQQWKMFIESKERVKQVWIPFKVDRNTARPNGSKKHWKAIKTACYLTLILRRKTLALFLTLKRFRWNWSILDILNEK